MAEHPPRVVTAVVKTAAGSTNWIVLDDSGLPPEQARLIAKAQRAIDDFLLILSINYARREIGDLEDYIAQVNEIVDKATVSDSGIDKLIYSIFALQTAFVQIRLMPRLRWRALAFFGITIFALAAVVSAARAGASVCDIASYGETFWCRAFLGPLFGHLFSYIDLSYPAYGVIFGTWLIHVYRNLKFSVGMAFLSRQLNSYPSINIALSIVLTYISLLIIKQGFSISVGGVETGIGSTNGKQSLLLTPGPSFLVGLTISMLSEKFTQKLLDFAGIFSDSQVLHIDHKDSTAPSRVVR